MGFWRQYKHIVYLMLIAGAVFLAALRFSTVITFGSAVFDALIPLVWGVLMAFILQIIVKRFERIYFPTAVDGWKAASRRPVCIVLAIVAILLAIFFAPPSGLLACPLTGKDNMTILHTFSHLVKKKFTCLDYIFVLCYNI